MNRQIQSNTYLERSRALFRLRSASLVPALALLLSAGGCSTIDDPQADADRARLKGELDACKAQYASLSEADDILLDSVNALRDDVASLAEGVAAQHEAPRDSDMVIVATETAVSTPATPTPEKLIVGRRESVWVEDLQLALPARVDTGAETSSLDSRDITFFERDGKSWVRFDIPNPGGGDDLTLERPKVRDALIVQANAEEPERRAVIKLGVQLGSVRQLAEFTLSDRGHLDYQMLVGRNILRDVMLVDVSGVNLVPLPENVTHDAAGNDNMTSNE